MTVEERKKMAAKTKEAVCGEAVADIKTKSCRLHGTVIKGDIIPKLIE